MSATPFHYSDGEEVESRILSILQSATDLTSGSAELARAITDWPTRIHFSPTDETC